MKRIIALFVALTCALFLFNSCEGSTATVWVTYKAIATGDIPAGALLIQEEMNAAIVKSLTGGSFNVYPDTKENDNAAIKACDAIFAANEHLLAKDYTILLVKSAESGQLTTLKTYHFTK